MTQSSEAGTTSAQSGNGGNGSSNGSTNGDDEKSVDETAAEAAELLAADVRRSQARINALATGLQDHHDELDQAESDYQEARDGASDDALRFAYTTLLNPVGLADQSRQVDTSGLGGFGSSAGVVHASNVFGSPVQRAVAAMAPQSPADPVTVIGAVPQSDLVDPASLERAKGPGRGGRHGGGEKKEKGSDSSS